MPAKPDRSATHSRADDRGPSRESSLLEKSLGEFPGLRRVEIDVDEDAFRLTGRVHTYYLKQLAQSIAMRIACDARVTNDIQVTRPR